MFDKNNIDEIAKRAKARLNEQHQVTEEKSHDEPVDLYAEMRDGHEPPIDDVSYHLASEPDDSVADGPVLDSINDYDVDEYARQMSQIQLDPLDPPVFIDGPTVSQVELWKKEWDGHSVLALNILEEYFIVRTLNRFEYKQLVALENVNALQREEVICNTCVLFPTKYDFKEMAIAKGGIPSTLAQIIMEASGFTKDYQVQVL